MEFSILFTTSKSLISRIFRWFTRSKASHSLLLLSIPGIVRKLVLDASDHGVSIHLWDDLKKDNTIIARYKVKVPNQEKCINAALQHLGKKYDYENLVGHGIVLLLKRYFGWTLKNFTGRKNKFVCSEFILSVDYNHSWPEFVGLDKETTSPQNILDNFERIPNVSVEKEEL